jgi:putative MATE family efflux protein
MTSAVRSPTPAEGAAPAELRGLWSLTWPLLWSLALSLSLSFVDSFFLSRVSDEAAAAVGALLPVLGLTLVVFSPVAQAGASVAGQLMGAGRHSAVPPTYLALVLFNAAFGVVASAVLLLLAPWLVARLGLSGAMAEHAVVYLRLVGGFQFVKAVQLAFLNILNSRGETRWVLAEAALTNASNVALNLIFVRAGLGVVGIAAATVISLCLGLAWTVGVAHYRLRLRLPFGMPLRQLRQHLRPILRIGLPGAMEPVSWQSMHVVLNAVILTFGAQAMAARVYVLNLFLVTTILWGVAFGVGTQISVARQVGAGNFEGAHAVLHRALQLTVLGN